MKTIPKRPNPAQSSPSSKPATGGTRPQAAPDAKPPAAPKAKSQAAPKAELAALDLGILPQLTGYQLRVAQIRVFNHFVQALAGFDLTPGLLGVLEIVGANQGLKQSELARAVHLDGSTMVSVIDKLEKRGWIERRAALNDRRAHGLWLAEAGRQALKQSLAIVAQHENDITRGLSATETKTLTSLLARVCR